MLDFLLRLAAAILRTLMTVERGWKRIQHGEWPPTSDETQDKDG